MNTFRTTISSCLLSVLLNFGCAADAPDSSSAALGETSAALAEGDHVIRCFQAELTPDDAPQCEDKSGSKIFEIGECKLEITRECQLRENEGQFRCCCRLTVTRANEHCDQVVWADLFGAP
jgi:hypothetical protein